MPEELPDKGSLNSVFGINKPSEWQQPLIDMAHEEYKKNGEPVAAGISYLMSLCGIPPIPGVMSSIPETLIFKAVAEIGRHFYILGVLRGVVLTEEKDWASKWEELMSKDEG